MTPRPLSEKGSAVIRLFVMIGITLEVSLGHVTGQERGWDGKNTESSKRAVTVADAIRMTQFGDEVYLRGLPPRDGVSQFSPDGTQFVVLTKKGNIEKNTNDYSLLLFYADGALKAPAPRVLVTFSSSSNRPGIQEVKWLDGRLISFLAENPGEEQQLYTFDCSTNQLRKLTEHYSSLASYAISRRDGRIFFTAYPRVESMLDERAKQYGIVVNAQPFPDLIALKNEFSSAYHFDLFVKDSNSETAVPVRTNGTIGNPSIWLAPDGRNLILSTSIADIPDKWRQYDDPRLQMYMRPKYTNGSDLFVTQYEVIDADTHESRVLIDAPIGIGPSQVGWSPDSRSVVVAGTYLPILGDGREQNRRRSERLITEVKIPSREIVPITSKDLKFLKWVCSNKVIFEFKSKPIGLDVADNLVSYQRTATGWTEANVRANELSDNRRLEVTIEEDMNTRPKIFVTDLVTAQKSILLDLNPQFAGLKFGHVEDIIFEGKDGHKVKGGVYYPPDFVPGTRHPLVIQTHGWNPHRFWVEGPYSTAFAAQPLAGKGIMVVQLEEDLNDMGTPNEVLREMAAYEGAIDYLDNKQLIDRDRVGIIAFSRTGYSVAYAITHSKYHFSAATMASTVDGGYFYYLASQNFMPVAAEDMEALYGGLPFGAGLPSWVRNSPGFNMEKVDTPIRLEANEPVGLTGFWEWFTGLRRLGKPVELIYMPDGAHILVKPWNRLTSQQGNVDWFCFWLNRQENPDPRKTEQYVRWRNLLKLQQVARLQVGNN